MRIVFFAVVGLGLAWVVGGLVMPERPGSTEDARVNQPLAQREDLPAVNLPSYGNRAMAVGNPCVGKPRCLVSYMAPWCPYCKASLPAYRRMEQLTANNPDLGVYLVVSAVRRPWQDPEVIAGRVQGPAYLDPNDSAWSRLAGRGLGVPAWVVYDGNGEILKATSGAVQSVNRVDGFLERMGLGGYR